MGKRKKKHRNLSQHQPPVHHITQPTTVAAPVSRPVEVREAAVYQAHHAEYNAISSDLIRVAIINGFFLAAVIALYFIDRSNPFLKGLFEKLI